MVLFVIQILKLYHTHFYYANKGVCFFMRAANGMGTVFKLSGKRRKPWAYLGPKYYSIEEKRYKRDFIACFKTQKEAETYKLAMFTNNIEMLENTDVKINKKKEKGITFEQKLTMKLILKEVKSYVD